MAAVKIKWSSLLNLSELEFIPEAPKGLSLSDEIALSLSLLTAATGHDRKWVRCNQHGAILVGQSWDNLAVVETDELYPAPNTPDSYTATVTNCGVLVASSTQPVKLGFVRVSGGATENIYIPPGYLYFYPHSIYSVTATTVPAAAGSASYVGITTFN